MKWLMTLIHYLINWQISEKQKRKLKKKEKIIKTHHNKAYSLWRVNGCQQGSRSVASFGFGGQKSASKPPQAICKPLAGITKIN
ncbi:hypothetical protein D1627_00190 [Pontibacter oryzae]|uniref:Uncharacterized protein n=1 Tax=Pontibacter oryzae TaxID=2304593 RepID=A0A399SFC1_9BACT|nr:hypothetical protein D1627_00190 [Pontibacter oryzae]